MTAGAAFSTTVPGMTGMDQLDVDLRGMAETFSPDDQKLLAVLNEEIRPYYCRPCHECSGVCPIQYPNCVHVTERLMRAQELFA